MLTATTPKPCKVCQKAFLPFQSMQQVCSVRCAARVPVVARNTLNAQAKKDKADLRARREKQETLPQLRKKAQAAFNSMIRARDAGRACICCGKFPTGLEALRGGAVDAGHFRSRGACPELAFDEDNCHLQNKRCNERSWDVASYRANLLLKIGPERLAKLEGPHPQKHYTKDDYRSMATDYRARFRALMKEKT